LAIGTATTEDFFAVSTPAPPSTSVGKPTNNTGAAKLHWTSSHPAQNTTMTQRPPNQPKYSPYSPLTRNESTSSELSNKNNMEEPNAGQPPTASSKTPKKPPQTPGKANMTPTRSSQQASAQGLISFTGLSIQEQSMLRYAVPFLIENKKHPARHPFIGLVRNDIVKSIKTNPNMTIEQLLAKNLSSRLKDAHPK
jgi:hypothetical protein